MGSGKGRMWPKKKKKERETEKTENQGKPRREIRTKPGTSTVATSAAESQIGTRYLSTDQVLTATTGGGREKVSRTGILGTTSVLLLSCQTHTSPLGAPTAPHQSTNYKHHTQYYYTEPVSPYCEPTHTQSPGLLSWASSVRSRNLRIHQSQSDNYNFRMSASYLPALFILIFFSCYMQYT